jgi:TonB family protein
MILRRRAASRAASPRSKPPDARLAMPAPRPTDEAAEAEFRAPPYARLSIPPAPAVAAPVGMAALASATLHAAALAATAFLAPPAMTATGETTIEVELVSERLGDAQASDEQPASPPSRETASSTASPDAVGDEPPSAPEGDLTSEGVAPSHAAPFSPEAPVAETLDSRLAAPSLAEPALPPPPEVAMAPQLSTEPQTPEETATAEPTPPTINPAIPAEAAQPNVVASPPASPPLTPPVARTPHESNEAVRRAAARREARALERAKEVKKTRAAAQEARRATQSAARDARGDDEPSPQAGRPGRPSRSESGRTASGADVAAFRAGVAARVAAMKRYPPGARGRGETGRPVVAFQLSPSGALAGASLSRSSGHAELDAEALAMVRRAAPFPKPPSGAPRNFSIGVSFDLR